MKHFLLLALLFVLPISAYSRIITELTYENYFGADLFNKYSLRLMNIIEKTHMVTAGYDFFDDMDVDYRSLHSAYAGYIYNGQDTQAGMIISSASDHLFDSMGATDFVSFAGYNLFTDNLGERSNGKGIRIHQLSLGFCVLSNKVFKSHVIPYIAYRYDGELVQLNIRIPKAEVTITPAEVHRITLSASVDKEITAMYSFKPFKLTTLSAGYEITEDSFGISEFTDNDIFEENDRLIYRRERFFVAAEQHLSKNIKLGAKYAYQPNGYRDYGDDFDRSRSEKLPTVNMVQATLGINF